MKKTIIAIPTLASAGAERFATELACNINRNNYECLVVVTKKLDKESTFYKKLLQSGIRVIDISNKNYLIEVINAIKLIRNEKPSIIHTNVGAALHMLLPIVLSGTKAKHIFTVHSMGYRIFAGAKKRLIGIFFKHGWIVPVGICDTVKRSLVDAYSLKETQVECVYNGVDTTAFQGITRRTREKIVFVTVGTLYYIKNQRLLIEAFSYVHEKYENTALIIVGDGVLREELEQYTSELRLNGSVIFVGNQADVAQFLYRSDIYCSTSLVEGLPISVLEAMATGLPVITTPAGGVVDIVKNEKNGYVVEAKASLIADKMLQLVESSELREKMGKQSRSIVEELDIRKCAQGYEKLYEKYS